MKIELRKCSNLLFENNVVILKKKNKHYYFLHQENTGQEQFEYYLGNKNLNIVNIENFNSNMSHNIEISNKYKFKYFHMISQSKEVAHKDIFKDTCDLKIDSIYLKNKDYFKSENVVYLELIHDDFLIGDHHYNDVGYLKSLSLVLNKFNINFHFDRKDYKTKIIPTTHGDLINKLNKKIIVDEVHVEKFLGVKPLEPIFDLRENLTSNSGQIKYYYNPRAILKNRLITFGDSFLGGGLDLYNVLFREIVHFRSPYILEDVVSCLKPDYVITQNAERYLINMNMVYSKPWFINYLFNSQIKNPINERNQKILSSLFSNVRERHCEIMENRFVLNINKDLNPNEITANDIKSQADVNYVRKVAINLENNNLVESLRLMNILSQVRPNSSIINDKISLYKKLLNLENI